MIIPDNVTVYMNGRAYYAHVCAYRKENERLSRLSLCFEGGGVDADRTDPPRREITVRAESGGKSVNISYDPHDAEAVKAVEVWRKALFAEPSKGLPMEPPDALKKAVKRKVYTYTEGSDGDVTIRVDTPFNLTEPTPDALMGAVKKGSIYLRKVKTPQV